MADKPTKGTVVSFGNTPQAKDDNLAGLGTEDSSGILYLNVMANDLAGNGKSLWATDDGISEGGERPVDLLAQDAVDAQGTTALGAKIWITADGRVAYQLTSALITQFQSLSASQTVTDSFTYAIQMGNGTLSWAKVNVTLAGTNDKPVVENVSIAAAEDGPAVTASFSGDDVDSDDDFNSLTYTLGAQPAIGTLTKSGTTFTYAPGNNFQELAQGETQALGFTYTATDKHGAVSAPAAGAITVTGVNDAPTLKAGASELTEDGATVTLNLAPLGDDIDSDNDGGNLGYSLLNSAPGGSATIAGTTLTLGAGSDFQGLALGETMQYALQVQAKDNHGDTAANTVTVKVTGVNDAPTFQAGTLAASEDGGTVAVSLTTLGDDVDSDDDGNSLDYKLLSSAPQGSATLNGKTLEFAPGAAFQGLAQGQVDTFTLAVQATDKHGASTPGSVTVNVTGTNDDPTLNAGKLAVYENGLPQSLDLSTLGDDIDSDDDGSTLSYAAPFAGPPGSTVAVSGTTFTFTPGTAFEQLPELVPLDFKVGIQATDKHGDSAYNAIDIRMIGKNDAPTLQAGLLAATEDGGAVNINLATLGDDIDNDDGPGSLVYTASAPPPGQGSAIVTGTGLNFHPGAGFQELAVGEKQDVVLDIQAADKHGATASNTLTVRVTGTNDAPTLAQGTLAISEDAPAVTLNLAPLGNDIDSDNDGTNLTYTTGVGLPQGTATVSGATLTIDPGTGYQYLAAGETSTFDLALKATDNHGLFANNVVKVSVSGHNDAPAASTADLSGAVTAQPGSAPFTVKQYNNYLSDDFALASLKAYAASNAPSFTATTTIIDYTDDPAGFAGEIPGSTPWPAAQQSNISGTDHALNDNFFARITGQVTITQADTYTFRTYNDDGVYLHVDNQLIISDSGIHPEKAFNGSIALNPGVYPIDLFYFENGGEASLEFGFKGSSGSIGHVTSGTLTDSGVINFGDVDLIDTHTVTVAPVGSNAGALTAAVTQDSTGTGDGHVTWTYNVANAALTALGLGQSKQENFDVTLSDGKGGTLTQQVSVTVNGANDAPLANSDNGSGNEDSVITINVLGNDTDPDNGSTLSVQSVSNGANGSVSIAAGGAVTYTPNKDFSGNDSFSYTVKDQHGATSSSNVTVTVNPVNDGPKIVTVPNPVAVNGSFESGLNGWTAINGGVDVVGDWQAANGSATVDLNALTRGGVTQTLPTLPGQTYQVNFALSQNPGADVSTVRVAAGASTADYTYNLDSSSNNMQWQSKAFVFTATSTSTVLSFTSLTPGTALGFPDDAEGPALDAVGISGNIVALEDTVSTIKSISVSDIDAGGNAITLNLKVNAGTLALTSMAGLSGDLNGSDGTLALTGSQASLNAALAAGVNYQGNKNFNGSDVLQLALNDQGQTGSGGALSDARNMNITVLPVDADAVNDTNALTASQNTVGNSTTVHWADWQTITQTGTVAGSNNNTYDVTGKITLPGGHVVDVTYSGQVSFVQLTPATDYYTGTNVYTSSEVANGPGTSDIIGLDRNEVVRTLTFSEPVENLYFAIVSMNRNGYLFDQDFDIVSYGTGYFGGTGSVSKFVTPDGRYGISTPPDGTAGGNEFHGVLSIDGAVQSLTWLSQADEFWNGFTVGTYGQAQSATVSGNVLTNDKPATPADLLSVSHVNGQVISGNSLTLNLASGAIVKVDRDGDYLYDDNNAFDALPVGQQYVDSFAYTVTDANGETDTAIVQITVIGS